MIKKVHVKLCLFVFFFFSNFFFPAAVYGEDTRFPVYGCIQPNVRFWTQVYTEYSTTQGILHDSENLNVIYEVIQLIHPDKYHAKRINEKRINAAKRKYRIILKKLSQNPSASDDEARRIAALFGEEGNRAAFRKAMYKIRCQVGQKDRFREGIIRSGAYIDQIKLMFRSYGLPIDLVYIPHVESSFNPRAYSKRGAAGIWQFVREAGKRTMTVGYALDERWDPILSSEAAAHLLKRSYEKFGSWPMAITAYNHGIAGVLKAKWKNGTYEDIFKYYKGNNFRFASRNFYSEFLAAREAAKNCEKYFGDMVPDPPVDSRTIMLAGYASIKDLARYFDVNIETLARLNPSLRPPVFKEQKYVPAGYALRLPAGALQNRSGDSMEIPPEMYEPGQKSSRIYRVKKGDSITKIAEMNGISVTDLFVANKLNSKGTIYINQNLRLPLPGEAADLPVPSYTSSMKIHRQKVQSSETTSGPLSSMDEALLPASELAVDPDMVSGNLQVEQVMKQKGKSIGIIQVEIEETLGHYAEWLEIPTRIIRNLNHLPYGRTLRMHQKIKIPLDKISKAQFEEMRFEYHKKIQEDFFSFYEIEGVQIYQLKKGDNIWSLGNDTFDLPVWLIKKYNPDIDFNNLRWSQKIVVPVVKEITDTGAVAVRKPSAVPLENLEYNPPVKGFWTSFRYFLIVMILISAIAALLYPMIRLQLMILERIKALSELTKHLHASRKAEGDGKSVQLKLINGKN